MKIVIVAEAMSRSAGELAWKARSLYPQARVTLLAEGADIAAPAGVDEVLRLPVPGDDCALAETAAEALRHLAPDIALFPATVRGRFLSAWIAARLDTGLTADCTDLAAEGGLLKQIRPAFGGSLTAEILCRARRPQMASVRPGVFEAAGPAADPPPERVFSGAAVEPFLRRLAFSPAGEDAALSGARVVVAGGKGLGGPAGFETLARLAALLGGAVGASRAAVDAGWIGYPHQVGQTGVIVRPELYLAFGINGSAQHVVGLRAAKVVVAVNADRGAPIFSCADYGVVGDWKETADIMISYLQSRRASV